MKTKDTTHWLDGASLRTLKSYLPHAREAASYDDSDSYHGRDALADLEHRITAAELETLRPARGGFDRQASHTAPDPIDVEIPMPGLFPPPPQEEPADEEPDDPTADILQELKQKALDAGHDIQRVDKAIALLNTGHVFDAGAAGVWIVFSESVDLATTPDDQLWDWTHGVGKPPPAQRYSAAPQPQEGQRGCTCGDAQHRLSATGGKCKHQIAAILATNIKRRLADPNLYALPH